jgi:uncharacterized repeat protein (TIGR03803 family)
MTYGGLPAGSPETAAAKATSGYQTLYRFSGSDGEYPYAGLAADKGTLYGTTSEGGGGYGTVFSISRTGDETVLHSFSNSDGAKPKAGLIVLFGVFYGTTGAGGTYGKGTLFYMDKGGNENVVYDFGKGADGQNPHSVLLPLHGNLYGVTYNGGAYGGGTAFQLTSTGKENVLHSFAKLPLDGKSPNANLIVIGKTLYGTTYGGGVHHSGTVYSLTTGGVEKVLHAFGSGNDGANPFNAGLLLVGGLMYGTTCYGGTHGDGTVFRITTAGKEQVVYNFGRTPHDGTCPTAGLIELNGLLYGTTFSGGSFGVGTIYSISGFGTEHVLHTFAAGSDGAAPAAPLTALDGVLYGTTSLAGNGYGTVFEQTP